MNWIVASDEVNVKDFADCGNRYLIANGYLGVRGTLDESGKEELAAINLAGIYDKVGDGWREPLNAPNPLHTSVIYNEKALSLESASSHHVELDYRYGVFKRETKWEFPDTTVTIKSRRFASMDNVHLIVSEYEVSVSNGTELTIDADIDTDIWEIYGPHYESVTLSYDGNVEACLAEVQNSDKKVAVARKIDTSPEVEPNWNNGFQYIVDLKDHEAFKFYSYASIYTTGDDTNPLLRAKSELDTEKGFEELLELHKKKWDEIWSHGEVSVEGSEEANTAINYALYHLNSIAPRHSRNLSIPARGLSGQTYKGAIFWDSEMFMLDYFLFTQPEVARSLVMYRIDTLSGAKEKAKSYGWEGAFYAWESQEGGYDACSDYNVTCVFTNRPMRTYFKDKQVHISAAVANAIMRYVDVTGDNSILAEGGALTVIECANFYASLLVRYANKEKWEIHDCIGPDEYHERVNNNAYTNRMAKETFDLAVKVIRLLEETNKAAYLELAQEKDLQECIERFGEYSKNIKLQKENEDGVIEQFDGYFSLEDCSVDDVRSRLLNEKEYWGGGIGVASNTRVIKQADVVAMLELFHKDYSVDTLKKNWEFYEPYTEHGSSLSACMYSLLACRFDEPSKAYPFFLKSAMSDLKGGGKQWAGLVYIGGTHPAAEGGAWMVLAKGFAGLEVEDGRIQGRACLPDEIDKISFKVIVRGKESQLTVTKDDVLITEV